MLGRSIHVAALARPGSALLLGRPHSGGGGGGPEGMSLSDTLLFCLPRALCTPVKAQPSPYLPSGPSEYGRLEALASSSR